MIKFVSLLAWLKAKPNKPMLLLILILFFNFEKHFGLFLVMDFEPSLISLQS